MEESVCQGRRPGSIPGLGRFPGEGNGNPLQYSCLRNPMDREAWQAVVHEVAKSGTWLSDWECAGHSHIVIILLCYNYLFTHLCLFPFLYQWSVSDLILKHYLFIYLFIFVCLALHWCTQAFSSGEQELLFVGVLRLLIPVASLVSEHGLWALRLQQLQHSGSVSFGLWAQYFPLAGLVAQRQMESSRTSSGTCFPCTDRWVLSHCTIRDVLSYLFYVYSSRV